MLIKLQNQLEENDVKHIKLWNKIWKYNSWMESTIPLEQTSTE